MFSIAFSTLADRLNDNKEIQNALRLSELLEVESLDTIINYDGYHVRCIIQEAETQHIGLNLFNDEIKESVDKEMLDYVETSLLADILGVELSSCKNYTFYSGDRTDLKNVTPDTPCTISNLNSRFLSFEWDCSNNKTLRLDVPISYEYANYRNRGDMENDLVNRIKTSNLKRVNETIVDNKALKKYKNGIYYLQGRHYLDREINRNVYFFMDSVPTIIKSSKFPAESISNIFIYPSSNNELINVEITVLKHELGNIEKFLTPLYNILAVCEADGCLPYWGLEDYSNGELTGSLFLYNWEQGYTHILKVQCTPSEVLNDTGTIKARASLYVPTNNISSLFDPIQ